MNYDTISDNLLASFIFFSITFHTRTFNTTYKGMLDS